MGGTETDPGIFINWTLRLGTTASRCITFNKFWPTSRDLVFDIRILELWVVNEVIMKKRNSPKRDFYSTVVMWNRIGKHNAKGDSRRSDSRDCDGPNTFTNDNQVIHENNERNFQPSATSPVGPHNTDENLILFAIKNRLVREPPTSALKAGAGLRPVNQELTVMSAKPRYNVDIQADKAKRSLAKVSPQITNCTISQSVIREGEYLHLPQQHTEFCRPPSKNLLPDELSRQSIQPRRNSFPNQTKRCSASSVPRANCGRPQISRNTEVSRNSIQNDRNSLSLPRVPDYNGASFRRPSGASRSIRNGTEEVPHNHQIHELSWPDRRGMGGARPHQQLLLQRGRGDRSDPNALKQSSIRSGTPSRNLNQPSITVSNLLSKREFQQPSHQSNRLPLNLRVKTERDPESPFKSPPIDLPMRTNDQLCRCGSKERNLICCCKKSILKEVEVPSGFRPCNCRNENRKRKEKKEKKRSPDKESKKEEKRRKKEEKEYKRRMKKERKEREKLRKNSNPKREKMSKRSKKSDKGCKMCKCCKCCGEEVTIVFPPESSQPKQKSRREKSPKKEKQPKIIKCRRTTNEYCRPLRSCECPINVPIRSIETEEGPTYDTEPPPYTQFSYPPGQVCNEEQVLHEEPRSLKYCSHPDIPCPAVGSRVQYRKSVTYGEINCRDTLCTNVRRCEDENNGSPVRSCCCRQQTQPHRTEVYAYPVTVDQQPNIVYSASSTEQTGNSRTHLKANQYSLPATNRNVEAMGYSDVTAAPALCSYEIGHGDTVKLRRTPDQGSSHLPHEFSTNNLLNDTSKGGHNNGTNKRYVPPCVLYLDCTKVKDLCVIIKDKYEEDPS